MQFRCAYMAVQVVRRQFGCAYVAIQEVHRQIMCAYEGSVRAVQLRLHGSSGTQLPKV
jgi:hypothetical protein